MLEEMQKFGREFPLAGTQTSLYTLILYIKFAYIYFMHTIAERRLKNIFCWQMFLKSFSYSQSFICIVSRTPLRCRKQESYIK